MAQDKDLIVCYNPSTSQYRYFTKVSTMCRNLGIAQSTWYNTKTREPRYIKGWLINYATLETN